jgi:hypothetical protein
VYDKFPQQNVDKKTGRYWICIKKMGIWQAPINPISYGNGRSHKNISTVLSIRGIYKEDFRKTFMLPVKSGA